MELSQFLYLSEAEGITSNTDTRLTRLNAAAKDFIDFARRGLNIDNPDIQAAILEDYDLDDLTEKEAEYIVRQVKANGC